MILSQSTDLTDVPDSIFKWVLIIIVGVVLITVFIYSSVQQKTTKLDQDPPPEIRKAAKRYNHELFEQRHADHEWRLRELEKSRINLTLKLESDKQEILDAGESRGEIIRQHVDLVRRELDGKIENIPDRIIATLKNTRAI